MNFRMIVYTGIMTALVGAMLGLGINYISQRTSRKPHAVVGGAVLGFVIGSAYQALSQNYQAMEQNNNDM